MDTLICSCRGRDFPQHLEAAPGAGDTGHGYCPDCLGKPDGKDIGERLGWAGRTFFESRFKVLQNALKDDNLIKFNAMTYGKKVAVVTRLIEKGCMI